MQLLEKEKVYEVFTRLNKNNPNPESELNWKNPYTLLVAVVLSAQATDKGVNKATKELFEIASSPQDMLSLGLEKLTTMVKTINYYPTKAKRIIALSQILIRDFNSKVPKTRKELETLPGVGRKTANVVLNVAFGFPTIAVDTHVLRVSNRLTLSFSSKPEDVEEDLNKIVPEIFKMKAHHHLILHGRYICKAKNPLCETCFLSDLCPKNF
jgi:endonuclease III